MKLIALIVVLALIILAFWLAVGGMQRDNFEITIDEKAPAAPPKQPKHKKAKHHKHKKAKKSKHPKRREGFDYDDDEVVDYA